MGDSINWFFLPGDLTLLTLLSVIARKRHQRSGTYNVTTSSYVTVVWVYFGGKQSHGEVSWPNWHCQCTNAWHLQTVAERCMTVSVPQQPSITSHQLKTLLILKSGAASCLLIQLIWFHNPPTSKIRKSDLSTHVFHKCLQRVLTRHVCECELVGF